MKLDPTILITGSTKRIGKELSLRFAKEGWNVVIHYHSSRADAEALSLHLADCYPDQIFPIVQANLQEGEDEVIRLYNYLSDKGVNKIDALINNASNFHVGSLKETNSTLLRNSFSVNFESPFYLMRHFYLNYKSGAILNFLDTRIVNNNSSHGAYSLSKKALESLTTMAALEWAPSVRVNGIAPGPVLPAPGKSNDHLQDVIDQTPLQRKVSLDNLIDSAYFLIHNDAITGQILFCDSGAHLT